MLKRSNILPSLSRPLCFSVAALFFAHSLQAGDVSLADGPMASGTSAVIKPNIMFVLDNSGSMAWSHMPDFIYSFARNSAGGGVDRYGYASAQCNGIFYNPNITYSPPLNADGTSFPNASFTAAKYNGFSSSSATVDLSSKFKAYDNTTSAGQGNDVEQAAYYYTYTGSQPALSYTYQASGSVDTGTTFYKECNSQIGSTPGKNVFTKVVVSGAAAQQNFANWYSYYRVRLYTMKTAAGKAFGLLSNPQNYRIGYTTHSYTGVDTNNSNFQKIDDYCGPSPGCTQRTKFYEKMYGASNSGGTPLRSALSKVGRIYAGKLLTGADDPVQYSCQQNFTILSTDGYWNGDGGVQIDGSTAIGNTDGTEALPMKDALNKSGTLADVAEYYYTTDLRTSNCTGYLGYDLCTNNVPKSGKDDNDKQHMTTFTLGLGIDGSLKYAEDYESGGSADFNAIKQGTKSWPDPTDSEDLHRIDDLWHAAVNGRGVYYSAKTPDSMASGIAKALAGVSARTGSAAAAATSNLEPVTGDNYAYVGMYRTQKWDGDIAAREIDLNTGGLSNTVVWSAQAQLDAVSPSSRKIYTSIGGSLKEFTSTNLTAAVAAKYFDAGPTNPGGQLTQYPLYSTTDKTAATAQSMIDFIRGDNTYEDESGNTSRLYRDREHVLGDVVNSQPVYIKKPPFGYSDDGYADYALNKATRQSAVLVGGNDGMLHAFNGTSGAEMWAYIPSVVVPNLYKLADSNYGNTHRYYVDGPITVGDVCFSASCNANAWKTIAVFGLGKGGRAYVALDVTDPSSPSLLWEFTVANDSNLGYSYGNPVITKLNGSWVVIVASGYNNTSPGDGRGHIFVLNAQTGSKIKDIVTDSATTDPSKSGIAKLNNWVLNPTYDNSTQYVYGGDLSGNLYRVDIVAGTATVLATVGKVAGAGTQPITTKPELGEIKQGATNYRVVFVGTGKYLGTPDIADNSMQSIYAIKDPLTSTWGTFRTGGGVVKQTLTASGQYRDVSNNPVDWSTAAGWYLDYDIADTKGERVNVDPRLQVGVLTVATNVPDPNVCNVGGTSYVYYFDYKTGRAVEGAAHVGEKLSNSLAVGINVIRVNGKVVAIVTTSDNKYPVVPLPQVSPTSSARRMYWRELIN